MLVKCDFPSSKLLFFFFCIFFFVFFFWSCPLVRLSEQVPPPLPLSPNLFLHPFILCCPFSSQSFGGVRGNCVPSKLPNIHFETRPPPSLLPKNIFISSVFTPLLLIHSFFFLLIFFFFLSGWFSLLWLVRRATFPAPSLSFGPNIRKQTCSLLDLPAKLHSWCSIKDETNKQTTESSRVGLVRCVAANCFLVH